MTIVAGADRRGTINGRVANGQTHRPARTSTFAAGVRRQDLHEKTIAPSTPVR